MGKVLLVTGASSEIVQELIRSVGSEYTTVIAQYNSSGKAVTALKEHIGNTELIAVQADFTDMSSTVAFADKIAKTGLVPDAIVHLASLPVGLFTRFDKMKLEDHERNSTYPNVLQL